MKLHTIKHTNDSKLWCGPAAIAAVTGYDTRTIHRAFHALCNQERVKGVYSRDLVAVLQALGCKVSRTQYLPLGVEKMTFAAWLRKYRDTFANNPVVVTVGHHFVTVLGRKMVDNHTPKISPVFLRNAPHRRKRVNYWHIIESTSEPVTWHAPAAPSYPPGYWAEVKQRAALLKLAATNGIAIDPHIHPNEWFVYPPDGYEDEKDPHYGDHLACGAEERSDRITTYLKLIGVPLPGEQIQDAGLVPQEVAA